MNRRLPLLAVMALALALTGCDTIRNAAGMGKQAPDEFAVLTKAPLVIPPDYNLMPPRPGAAPTNQTEPTEAAAQTLFGNDPQTVASNITGNYSEGEKLLMAYAGIQNADPAIRAHLASDHKAMMGADDDFTNEILFWKGPKTDPGKAVDADAEAKRLSDQKAGIAPNQAQKSEDQPQPEKKGWLDGWFDWL